MSKSFYHKDLTDAQWNKINFLFPKANRVGRPALNSRMVLNAILWILRNGARWRDLPSNYGHWNSIYHKFRLWCKIGIFEKILQLVNQDSEETTLIEIDSTWYIKVPVLHSKIKISALRAAVKIPKFTFSLMKECK